jgi:hypothetical protein
MELMLESYFFHKKDALIRTIKLNFLITNLYSKGFEKYIRVMGVKKRTLFDILIRFWHSK